MLRAQENAQGFVSGLKGKKSAIDECQLAPELFPALKLKIGTSSIPGRYILTGSVRFSSRNAIRESLAGRIVNREILPFVLTELAGEKNSNAILKLFERNAFSGISTTHTLVTSLHREYKKQIEKYLVYGGLPTICFVRSIQTRKNLLRDILETILDRDLRLVYPTTVPYQQLFALCREIAMSPTEQLNYQQIKRETGLSPSTIKKILRALEGVFLIRPISLMGDYRGEIYWFEDQLERHFFAGDDEIKTADWVSLLYRNIRAQFIYRVGDSVQFYCYRTRGGAEVPLVAVSNHRYLGFFILEKREDITRSILASAESFLKKYGDAKIIFALKDENKAEVLNERMAMVPLASLIFG